MTQFERIYLSLPVWIQNILCSIKGGQIKRRRYNKGFYEELSRFENRDYNQTAELRDFLLNIKDVPAYSQYFTPEITGLLTEDANNVYQILKLFPVIDKATVKENQDDYINKKFVGSAYRIKTSGTTGTGLSFPYPVEFENKQWAVWWRFRKSLGLDLDTWQGWFGGKMIVRAEQTKPPYWRINLPGKQVMFSTYHINASTIEDYHKEINKRNLTWLHGYPSTLAELSNHIIQGKLPSIECVKVITTGAENLSEYQIIQMQMAFPNAVVRTHYGLTEGVANISQDREGQWRVDDDFSFVEFVPVNEEGLCRIVGTGFFNSAFPLVRYDTGDLAYVKQVDGKDSVISIEGRQADFLKLNDGQRLGPLNQLTKDCLNITGIQYVQCNDGNITIRIVRGADYTREEEEHLLNNIHARIQGDYNFSIEYVDSLEKTKAGKVRLVVKE